MSNPGELWPIDDALDTWARMTEMLNEDEMVMVRTERAVRRAVNKFVPGADPLGCSFVLDEDEFVVLNHGGLDPHLIAEVIRRIRWLQGWAGDGEIDEHEDAQLLGWES